MPSIYPRGFHNGTLSLSEGPTVSDATLNDAWSDGEWCTGCNEAQHSYEVQRATAIIPGTAASTDNVYLNVLQAWETSNPQAPLLLCTIPDDTEAISAACTALLKAKAASTGPRSDCSFLSLMGSLQDAAPKEDGNLLPWAAGSVQFKDALGRRWDFEVGSLMGTPRGSLFCKQCGGSEHDIVTVEGSLDFERGSPSTMVLDTFDCLNEKSPFLIHAIYSDAKELHDAINTVAIVDGKGRKECVMSILSRELAAICPGKYPTISSDAFIRKSEDA